MIIGITGFIGAGKTTVGALLKKEFGFKVLSLSSTIRDELNRRGDALIRKNFQAVAAELRNEFGKAVLAERALKQVEAVGGDWIIESVRHPEEAVAIQKTGLMLGVVASEKVRHSRIVSRGRAEDEVALSFEDFKKEDLHDRNLVDMDKTLENCDFILSNDSTLDQLKEQLDALLKKIRS
ncbi:MAG: AAA family ATPase [Candidatus Altiarchaeota archaeon]|nr:AAA family ATPase [Candidatus Altiarchaeota archaeon]